MEGKETKQEHYRGRAARNLQRAREANLTGLKRLILPEHNRPFIQKLSAAAGKVALLDLKNMT